MSESTAPSSGRPRDFALEVHFSKWEFVARYNLTASDAQTLSLGELLALAEPAERQAFEELSLGYTETYGHPRLRAAIAATYREVDLDEVLCFAGAGEGIYVAMRSLLEPDDHVIVITPNYQSAESIPLQICEVSGVSLERAERWSLDLEQLEAAIRPTTKLVSINFPNNPTGFVPSETLLEELVALCRSRGIWLFCDEVYRGIELEPERRIPQIVDVYERGLSLNVLSKAYGLPGLRIGWLACRDRELLRRCERYKHYLSICNAAPSEALATIALSSREVLLERTNAVLRRNAAEAASFFGAHAELFDWIPPDGGCVGFVRYKGNDGVEEMTKRLVEEAGVLLLPSSLYRSDVGAVPDDHFRIGIGRDLVPEALEEFDRWLREGS